MNNFLLAFVGSEAVGYAKLCTGEVPSCVQGADPVELERLYLSQRFIGKGYGGTLMHRCLEEASRMGARTLWLEVWDRNERARSFYRRWGFREVGTIAFDFGDETHRDVVMERPVRDGTRGGQDPMTLPA